MPAFTVPVLVDSSFLGSETDFAVVQSGAYQQWFSICCVNFHVPFVSLVFSALIPPFQGQNHVKCLPVSTFVMLCAICDLFRKNLQLIGVC